VPITALTSYVLAAPNPFSLAVDRELADRSDFVTGTGAR
jgi:hypothetical protein